MKGEFPILALRHSGASNGSVEQVNKDTRLAEKISDLGRTLEREDIHHIARLRMITYRAMRCC